MNRRDFIVGAAAAGLALRAGAEGRDRTSAPTVLFGACCPVGRVPLLKKAGYDFFEWDVASALGPDRDAAWWKRQKETLLAAPLPLRSCNGFIPGHFRLTGPKADHKPALAYAETALRRAEEVGVKTIVFGSGGARNVPGDFAGAHDQWPDLQKGAEQYAEFCRALCRRVADLKTVQVVIEPLCPNESNIVNFVWQGLQICEDVNSPRLAQLADFYHMMAGRESAESVVRAGARLKHCHVAESGTRNFPGADPQRNARLKPYFDALKAIGYAGGVSCECGWGVAEDYEKNLAIALRTMRELAG